MRRRDFLPAVAAVPVLLAQARRRPPARALEEAPDAAASAALAAVVEVGRPDRFHRRTSWSRRAKGGLSKESQPVSSAVSAHWTSNAARPPVSESRATISSTPRNNGPS